MDENRENTLGIENLGQRDWEAYRRAQANRFPNSRFGYPSQISRAMLHDIETALASDSEEAIQRALSAHPYAIQYAISNSGHHGIWAYPKQMIKPKDVDGRAGLIPDFLVVTQSSLGLFWHVVELKCASVQFSNRVGDALSPTGNAGLTQCQRYLAHFDDYIDAVRSSTGLTELVRPEGAVLLIGDAARETDPQRRVRANQTRGNERIQIVSYDRIRRAITADLLSRGLT